MRGGENVRLRRRLESLQRAAEGGNQGAAGEARLLATWLDDEEVTGRKRQDDRIKILIGAWIGTELSAGRSVALGGPTALLEALSGFLVRPGEREAVLGAGRGSEAFWRVVAPGRGHDSEAQ